MSPTSKTQHRASSRRGAVDWPVVAAVALFCALSMLLFFVAHHRNQKFQAQIVVTPPEMNVADSESVDSAAVSDRLYYDQLADEYIATLPSDKQLVVRMVDDENHHLVYFETSNHPSCYILDLESQTTEVLFGGDNGFYCDTKLLIIGTIRQWMLCGDMVYFVADNRAPEASPPDAVHVFALSLADRQLRYVDSGFDAELRQPDQLYIGHATLLYHSLFTGEDVYQQSTDRVRLPGD